MPLYVATKIAVPQLIWGISSTVASAILHAWGFRNLDYVSPWDPKNTTYLESHNRHASKCLSLVSSSASSLMYEACKNSKFSQRLKTIL
jgi:hypothetical protein